MVSIPQTGANPKAPFLTSAAGLECDAVLPAALEYARAGWSVIPIAPSGKKAAKNWRCAQKHRATEIEVDYLFRDSDFNLAVVLGNVSGGLAVRDFDPEGSYTRWAAENQLLAKTFPVVATGRPGGHHAYFRMAEDVLTEIRQQFSSTGRGAIDLGDGELRCDTGCYVVLPPSRHPDGPVYQWVVPLDGEVPLIDPREVGLVRCWANAGDTSSAGHPMTQRVQRVTASVLSAHSALSVSSELVELAIRRTLPPGPGQRRNKLFQLARQLKAIPELADRSAGELRPVVEESHQAALPYIKTKPLEASVWNFREAWDRVRFPAGEDIVGRCFAAAKDRAPPKCAEQYEGPGVRRLVALCRELQREYGERPFFLSCRTAGSLLGIGHKTASNWLRGLCGDGILGVVERPPRPTRKALRYKYLGDM